jgi:hypothetical protein
MARSPYRILQKSAAAIHGAATLRVNFRLKMFADRTRFGSDLNDEVSGGSRARKSRLRELACNARFSALSARNA